MSLGGTEETIGTPLQGTVSGVTEVVSAVDGSTVGLAISASLVTLLAYFAVLHARANPDPRVYRMVLIAVVPLLVAFAGIVLYESLHVVDIL